MKNSLLSAFLALWFALMPGFGLAFLSGNPLKVEPAQNEKSTGAIAATKAAPSGAVVNRQIPIVTKNQVASGGSEYPSPR